jgi:hypothetical protein
MAMRRRFLAVLLALTLLAGVGPAGHSAAQPTPTGITVQTQSNLHLRALDSTTSAALLTVPFETSLPAEAINAARTWVRVTYDGQTGWLYFTYLTVTGGSLADLPVAIPGQSALNEAAGFAPVSTAAVPGGLYIAREGFTVPHAWQGWVPEGSRAETFGDAAYVLYVRHDLRSGLCAAGDYEGYLTFSDFALTLVDRATGQIIARATLRSDTVPPAQLTPYGRFEEAWGWAVAHLSGST